MTEEQKEIAYKLSNSIIKAIANMDIEDMWGIIEKTLEQQPCEDCISRAEALKHSHIEYDDDGEGHRVIYAEDIEELPTVTPKAELWSRLYIWLNDMHLGISPDEFTPDDERKCREAQTDIIEDIMGWIEANVFEPKAGSED